jgi:uncharacterized protein (TIGR02246 family)
MPNIDPTAESAREEVRGVLRRINQAWLEGRPRDLAPLLHPRVVMVAPGSAGRAEGREALVAGFVDFCDKARIHAFEESDHQVDVAGGAAVTSFAFTMVYELDGQRYRSTGRDLWVFGREGGEWLAAWRTMLDVTDEPE